MALTACAFAAHAVAYSNRFRSPRNPERPIRKATRLVVLHTTEAHARSSLNKLCERGEAHYCVVENGTIYRIVDREREAFHAGRSMWNAHEDCDAYSVGIEVVGYHNRPVTLQQLEALRELVGNLKKIYNLTDAQVVCHSHVAYGAPNRWQRRNHRGRKRCGMLFAMPSVRSRLGLRAKPAYDPDVRAGRLVQADTYLAQVLYGNVDTMGGRFGAAPAAPQPAAPNQGPGILAGLRAIFRRGKLVNPAPAPEQSLPAKAPPASGQTPPASVKTPPAPVQTPAPKASAPPAPAPKADPVRDLAMLRKLPGYVQGGPTSATRSPFAIAGKKWNSPTTYYYSKGVILRGDRVNPRTISPGTLIFYRK